ncbi:MAG: hypothetical protein K6T73_01250 [Candidatus Bathyarchaeota archaeon]|nr:hypothetical protein [Candidatus Bathyarchaeota archaeon]
MSKKDYVEFAKLIARASDPVRKDILIDEMSRIFKYDNPRFDEKRFREYIKTLKRSIKDWLSLR